MRALMAFVFALVVAALVLIISTPARQGAERVLFGKGTSAESAPDRAMPQQARTAQADPVQNVQDKAGGSPAAPVAEHTPAPSVAAATVTDPSAPLPLNRAELPTTAPAGQPSPPKRTEQPKPALVPQQAAAAPAKAPAQQPVAQQPRARTGTQRVFLPPALSLVSFGMSAAQVRAAYSIAWTKQESGELMLVHYPAADKGQMVRFHFSRDSLYLIEARIKPAAGQSLKELYDVVQAQYAARFPDVAESSLTHWSDGTVVARIETAGDSVQIVYSCPSAKLGG